MSIQIHVFVCPSLCIINLSVYVEIVRIQPLLLPALSLTVFLNCMHHFFKPYLECFFDVRIVVMT